MRMIFSISHTQYIPVVCSLKIPPTTASTRSVSVSATMVLPTARFTLSRCATP